MGEELTGSRELPWIQVGGLRDDKQLHRRNSMHDDLTLKVNDEGVVINNPVGYASGYFIGGGSRVTRRYYDEAVNAVMEHTGCTLPIAQKAAYLGAVSAGCDFDKDVRPEGAMTFDISVGDRIVGGRTYYDEYGSVRGIVTRIETFRMDGKMRKIIHVASREDGYEKDYDNNCSYESVWQHWPADVNRDSGNGCHYCGMPATSFGFFDEPVCDGCGG